MAAAVKTLRSGRAVLEVKVLRDALANMVAVVERRNTIPICATVLLRVGPSTMTLVATDMDVELRQQIALAEAGTNEAFAVCVVAHTLDGIVKKLPKGAQCELTIDHAIGQMVVTAGRSRISMPTLSAEDFPEMVSTGWSAQFEMDRGHLTQLIASTAFAQSTEETRYYLNGIFVHVADGELFGAATDGHRLARFNCDAPEGTEALNDSIVPRKVVGIIDKLLDTGEGPIVDMAFSERKMRFGIGTLELVAKLIDGTFPDYRRVIPTANDKALWIEPKVLAEAVDRVATILTDKTRIVRFELTKDLLTLIANSPENGTATEEVPCSYAAEPIILGLNARYVLDICGKLTSDTAQVLLGDPASPTLWRDSEESQRLFVLMPARA